ncbi:hypothetical protein F2Q69_00013921 [Brassica cretica]|uniref:Uncharacterized protein n=1 Tax=Brassica cretica TaxID=69181 RepID=A0A8S9QYL1_BRACR|nr:hypothetical protein F2Q69_00013921 [Brassica cretica]
MVAPLILVRDNNGDLHDQKGHLRKAAGQRIYAQGATIPEPDANATACHCGEDYETDYSASIETHTATSIDSGHQISTDKRHEESVDSRPDDWENDYYNPAIAAYTRQHMHIEEYDEDYEEERATKYRVILDEEDKLLHHSSWKRNAPSIDVTINHAQEGDYSIGSWADEHHHESFAVETTTYAPGAYNLRDSFPDKELFNMQKRDGTDQIRAESAWERTRFSHPIDRAIRPSIDTHHQQSIDNNNATSIDNRPIPNTTVKDKFDHQFLTPDEFGIFIDPDGYAKAIDGRTLHVSREDIADIIQTANGADNMFMHHRSNLEQKAIKEFYDTASGIDNIFIQKSCHPTHTSIDVAVPTSVDRQPEFGRRAYDLYGNMKFYWEEKDEYGVYRDDRRYTSDLDGNTICLRNTDIRRTKLVPEIYTKDKINKMFYGVCGKHKKDKEAFQMKLDGVYYPLNDSTSWLTTCMEEMKQNITRIQHTTDVARPPSIDGRRPPSIDMHHYTSIDNPMPASIDDSPPRPHMKNSQKDFYTREEIDQLVEEIYRALETTEERLDGRCDDIYFPMDLSISALTSKNEAIQKELVEIQSYIARRPEASLSIDRCNNISTDIHH